MTIPQGLHAGTPGTSALVLHSGTGCTVEQDPGLKASPKAPLFTLSPPFDCVEVSAVCWGEGAGVDPEQNWVLPAF